MPEPEAVAAAVARNVRRLRRARGWTLDTLAARSGVSKGMLVGIEGGRTNPSIGTLCRVAEAFDANLGLLVELDETPVVRRVRADEAVRLWRGASPESEGLLLMGSDRGEHLELWEWRIAAGDAHAGDPHPGGTREFLYVLEGALTLDVDAERLHVPAGELLAFDADRPHRYANDGDRPLRFVMLVAQPPVLDP